VAIDSLSSNKNLHLGKHERRKMMDIRTTLKPFATVINNNKRKPRAKKVHKKANIYLQEGKAEIYNDGNGTTVEVNIWGYSLKKDAGSANTPGPTIEVHYNSMVDINWINRIPNTAKMPVKVVVTGASAPPTPYLHNVVGHNPADKKAVGDDASAFTVTHFHGGKTAPPYDGWPESMMAPMANKHDPSSMIGRHKNEQRGGLYWYHDHAMHTTRLNAFAGLSGCWLIHDKLEKDVGLWDSDSSFGKYDEFILVLQDRNVSGTYDSSGQFTADGKLLHRVESGFEPGNQTPIIRDPLDENAGSPLEFFGPLTLINGTLWPKYKRLDAGLYRVRILNGSNARTHRLHLLKRELSADGQAYNYTDCSNLICQIGTDCGLLPEAIPLPDNSLTLAPAERADLLIDFSNHPDAEFIIINSAPAPFSAYQEIFDIAEENGIPMSQAYFDAEKSRLLDNALLTAQNKLLNPDGTSNSTVDPDDDPDRNPYPEVLMFCIGAKSKSAHPDTKTLTKIKTKMKTKARADFNRHMSALEVAEKGPDRTIVLWEKEMTNGSNMLIHKELVPKAILDDAKAKGHIDNESPLFSDHLFTIDGVPHYVVAERFQDPVSYMVKHGTTERWRFINLSGDTHPMHIHLVQFVARARSLVVSQVSPSNANNILVDIDPIVAFELDANEVGFKDTIRVNPNEMVEVEALFEGYCGRYLYHCHILEHEDHDMMRQFIVTRDDDYGHGHMWPVSVKI